jgi:CubicO group peptidase (beta-lactamase class C family)
MGDDSGTGVAFTRDPNTGENKFYGDFLQERVFGPLGMSTTRIISEEDIIPNRAAGYRVVKGQLKNQEWVSPTLNTTADGSLYFSILDLEKWDAALTQGNLLKKSSFDEMWTIQKLKDGKPNSGDYGFGWFCRIFTVIRSSSTGA